MVSVEIRQQRASEARQTESSVRPQKAWTSERMRKILQRESTARMGVRLNISAWRQVSIAIARKFIREEYRFDTSEGEPGKCDEYDEDNHQGDSAWDLQAGHGTRVAGMIYARLLFEGEYEMQSQKEKYRQISQEWHQFLGFSSAMQGSRQKKRKMSHWEEANQEMQQLRWKRLKTTNVQARLESMLGEDAHFRGEQKAVINSILKGHSPIVYIASTGGGKSMAFMLPASCVSGGTSIVIVPLVALQGDLQKRCEAVRMSSLIWSNRRPYENASIIFVTPESAVSKTFAGFLNRLQGMHQLDRIVIDECHTILDGSPSFRPKLRQLGELALIGAQMVYLTATLPPRDEVEFCQKMHIDRQCTQWFRGRTTRRNVRYQVVEVSIPETNSAQWVGGGGFAPVINGAVAQLVQQKLVEYPAPAKMIIYSSIVKGAEDLGEVLGCKAYHRGVDTRDGMASRLDDWRNARNEGSPGQGRVIVATNALGLGVDVPDIRVVIHVGKIWALKDYAQESGRAGRDGKKSEAIIVRGIGVRGDNYDQRRVSGQIDIQEFLKGDRCRREILDEVMDAPRARLGCELEEETCDVCQRWWVQERHKDVGGSEGRPTTTTSSSPPVVITDEDRIVLEDQARQRRWTRQQVIERRCREGMEVKEMMEYLDEWNHKCPLCHLRSEASPWHQIKECPREEAKQIMASVDGMVGKIRYERFSCCYYCGVPQAICNRWEQKEEQGWWREKKPGSCQYIGLVVPAIAALLQEGDDEAVDGLYRWMQESGVDIRDEKSVYKWMGEKIEWGGIEVVRLMQVFHRLAGQHGRQS